MPRNYWKWTAPLLCVTCLGWVYSQEKEGTPAESQPTYNAPRAKSSDRNPLTSEQPAAAPTRNHFRVRAVPRSVPTTVFVPLTDEEVALHQEYFNAVSVLKSDEPSEVTRKQAKEKLVEVLGKMVDSDLEDRKEEVTTLEKRVTKMRAQFDKRKAAQDRIIDLRMKTIQNEVDGLGGNPLQPAGGVDANILQVEMNDFGRGIGSGVRTGIIVDSVDKPTGGLRIGRAVETEEMLPGKRGFGGGGGTYESSSEMGPGFYTGDNDSQQTRPKRSKVVYRTVIEEARVEVSPAELAENQQYGSSLEVLKSDEGDAAKETARNTIRQLLVTRFTRDLESREKDLVELESRVKKLREQLDKRIAARDQIIDLQMTTLQNNIDGLGFDGFQTTGSDVLNMQIEASGISPGALPAEILSH